MSLVAATIVVYFYFPAFILDCAKKALRWQAGLSRHTIQVDDHGWVYLEGGKGETILFVHGFGMEKDGWGLFPKAFSRSYRLIFLICRALARTRGRNPSPMMFRAR